METSKASANLMRFYRVGAQTGQPATDPSGKTLRDFLHKITGKYRTNEYYVGMSLNKMQIDKAQVGKQVRRYITIN